MSDTTHLALPLIAASQAQKHVPVNESLRRLDVVVQLAVLDRDLAAPPGSPAEGDRYIVAGSPTGAWAGHAGDVAAWLDGAWEFFDPGPGWVAWVNDEATLVYWTGAAWANFAGAITVLQNLQLLGVGTTADATNPFSAKLNKALWTAKTAAEGGDGDLRYTLNKETAADVLSFLLQRGFSGRAEIGLVGDDNLTIKVSPDGSSWTTALTVDRTTGLLTAGAPVAVPAGLAAAPGLQVGDADTGLFQTAGNLSATIDGVKRFEVGLQDAAFVGSFYNDAICLVRTVSDATSGYAAYRYGNNASAPTMAFAKARGTSGTPSDAAQNDVMGQFQGQARTGGSFRNLADVSLTLIEPTPSSTAGGARVTVNAAPLGSVTRTEVARFEPGTGLSLLGANVVIDQNRHHRLRSYTVGTLPSASPAGQVVFCSDGAANKRLAVSDGTAWRFPDGTIVS